MTATPVFDRTGFTGKFGALVVPGLNVSSAFNPVPIARTGEWVGTPVAVVSSSQAIVQNNMYFTPVVFPDVATLEGIGVKVAVASTLGSGGTFSRIELAIYNDDGSGNLNPGTLLLDAGHIDATSTTWAPLTISQALPSAGLYWLAAVWQADGTTPGIPQVVTTNGPVIGLPTSSGTPYASATTGYSQTVSGAVPSTAAVARTGNSTVPRIMVQHA